MIDGGNAGIFDVTTGDVGFSYATISNLKLYNVTINQTAVDRTGAIVKRATSGIYENLLVNNSIIWGKDLVGGVFGDTNGATLRNITVSDSTIVGLSISVGGIAGSVDNGGTSLFSHNNYIQSIV